MACEGISSQRLISLRVYDAIVFLLVLLYILATLVVSDSEKNEGLAPRVLAQID